MSTRATITVADEHDSFDIYQHHDGYPDGPHGLVRHIAMAQRLAWDLPRFEAADFSAAIIAVLKDRGGSTYLTKDAEAHGDRDFHYRVEPLRAGVATSVQLTITRPSWEHDKPDLEVFMGDIKDAVQTFDAVAETPTAPREWLMLSQVENALFRATEDIIGLSKDTSDPNMQTALNALNDAGRTITRLSHHLEKIDPWEALTKAETILETMRKEPGNQYANFATTDVRLVMDAHRRFQRD